MFLTETELAVLTGRKRKADQIAQLRIMGLPFFVNAAGRPVVTCSAVEGSKQKEPQRQWIPAALRSAS